MINDGKTFKDLVIINIKFILISFKFYSQCNQDYY